MMGALEVFSNLSIYFVTKFAIFGGHVQHVNWDDKFFHSPHNVTTMSHL